MAYAINIEAPKVSGVLATVRDAFNGYIEALIFTNSRAQQIEELNNLTDAELAAKGLRRDDIVRHVYADKYFI